jgi:hypothetical protein
MTTLDKVNDWQLSSQSDDSIYTGKFAEGLYVERGRFSEFSGCSFLCAFFSSKHSRQIASLHTTSHHLVQASRLLFFSQSCCVGALMLMKLG